MRMKRNRRRDFFCAGDDAPVRGANGVWKQGRECSRLDPRSVLIREFGVSTKGSISAFMCLIEERMAEFKARLREFLPGRGPHIVTREDILAVSTAAELPALWESADQSIWHIVHDIVASLVAEHLRELRITFTQGYTGWNGMTVLA